MKYWISGYSLYHNTWNSLDKSLTMNMLIKYQLEIPYIWFNGLEITYYE